MTFSLIPLAHLHHFLICDHFWFNTLFFAVHWDATESFQNSECGIKVGLCMLIANFVSHCVFAVQTMWFICVYLHFFLFCLQTAQWHSQLRNQKTDMTNNCTNNLNGSNMYDVWAIKWLYGKACESEFDYLWQNVCGGDNMENYHSWKN